MEETVSTITVGVITDLAKDGIKWFFRIFTYQ